MAYSQTFVIEYPDSSHAPAVGAGMEMLGGKLVACHFGDAIELLEHQEKVCDPMTEVADRYAHRLALALECVLMDRHSDRWWNESMQLIGEYRSAMNAIHEQHSPTFMGEPRIEFTTTKPEGV